MLRTIPKRIGNKSYIFATLLTLSTVLIHICMNLEFWNDIVNMETKSDNDKHFNEIITLQTFITSTSLPCRIRKHFITASCSSKYLANEIAWHSQQAVEENVLVKLTAINYSLTVNWELISHNSFYTVYRDLVINKQKALQLNFITLYKTQTEIMNWWQST